MKYIKVPTTGEFAYSLCEKFAKKRGQGLKTLCDSGDIPVAYSTLWRWKNMGKRPDVDTWEAVIKCLK